MPPPSEYRPVLLPARPHLVPSAQLSPRTALLSLSLSLARTRTHLKSLAHLAPVPLWIQVRAGPEILRLELMREEGRHCQPPCHRVLSLRSCNATTSCLCPDSKSPLAGLLFCQAGSCGNLTQLAAVLGPYTQDSPWAETWKLTLLKAGSRTRHSAACDRRPDPECRRVSLSATKED